MKLSELLKDVLCKEVQGSMEITIGKICFDSRNVEKGDVFVAQRGAHVDGHAFIDKAVAQGAVAVVCEEMPNVMKEEVVYVVTENSSEALGWMASRFYGEPSRKMKLVGVTGTNGKTTTATLLYEMAKMMGEKAGLLSTVCNYVGEEKVPSSHTTPDALEINRLMRKMVDKGCKYCFMEVSSHAADQRRVSGLDFDGAIFTNITHDHLDYHKTFRAYIEAKKGFFDRLPASAFALTNEDDKNGMVMLQNTRARKYSYACRRMADFMGKVIEKHLDGMLLSLNGTEVWVKFTGEFNAYNLLAVYAAANLLGDWRKEDIVRAMSMLVPVSGRFETILSREGVMAIVDYAHTPDALKNVLSTIAGLKQKGMVLTVMGAGGDRDNTKRPEMAKVACQWSDRVILTSDNPRSEEPTSIIEDMKAGIPAGADDKVLSIPDRREAIRTALILAHKGDIVLVAGKGHEDYQEIKGVKHHFDDKEVIKEIFKL